MLLPCAVAEQVPADNVQLPSDALFVVSVNVTVPVGLVPLDVTSVTVAANMVLPVARIVFGVAVTLVDVTSAVTVTAAVPEEALNSPVTAA
jgi:hypothetical protein